MTWIKGYGIAVCAGALALMGCRTVQCWDNRVTLANVSDVAVEQVSTGHVGQSITAQIRLRSLRSSPVQLRLRFSWLDGAGQAVAAEAPTSAWRRVSLAPQEVRFVDAVAPDASCASFMVYIQEAD